MKTFKKLVIYGISLSLFTGCENLFVEKEVLIAEKHPMKSSFSDIFTEIPNDFMVELDENVDSENEEPPGTEEPEALPVVSNPEAMDVMVNKFWSLPEGYRPGDLVKPNVPFSFGNENSDRSKLRAEAAESLEVMFQAARGDGIELYARSGFRSFETQSTIFQNEIATSGYDRAVLYVALPGTSEHQTGLAMDITAKSVGLELVEEIENTAEGKWLAENAHHYGFILRYPKGKTDITGYAFEPWHFRYVGIDMATEIFTKDITLEEHMGDVRGF